MSEAYTIAVEPWSAGWWADARPLAEAHFAEVDGGVEPRRQFKLDGRLMGLMQEAGALHLVTARSGNGDMVGYFTWQTTLDVESEGLLIAQQGAWYAWNGHFRLAVRMFDFSMEHLRSLGVQCIFPHHRMQGRGCNIGRFFRRRGAKLIQHTYCLWIGDGQHA